MLWHCYSMGLGLSGLTRVLDGCENMKMSNEILLLKEGRLHGLLLSSYHRVELSHFFFNFQATYHIMYIKVQLNN